MLLTTSKFLCPKPVVWISINSWISSTVFSMQSYIPLRNYPKQIFLPHHLKYVHISYSQTPVTQQTPNNSYQLTMKLKTHPFQSKLRNSNSNLDQYVHSCSYLTTCLLTFIWTNSFSKIIYYWTDRFCYLENKSIYYQISDMRSWVIFTPVLIV